MTSKILGVPVQTLGNWVRLGEKGEPKGAGDKPVSPEPMEVARLRAELSLGVFLPLWSMGQAATGRTG